MTSRTTGTTVSTGTGTGTGNDEGGAAALRPGARVLLTVGHGTAGQDRIADLLQGAGVRRLVDVRRFPGSRRHPHVARDAMARWLPDVGIDYRWEPRLGGRRRHGAGEAGEAGAAGVEVDTWWQVDAFRAYAAHTRSPEFGQAMEELADGLRPAGEDATVVMCSEAVWWRCHRRLVSDVAVLLHRVDVRHLGHDGRLVPHPPSPGARVTPQGLVYDRPRDG